MEQKMSKQMASERKPPGVIARLMGLDAVPAQRLNPILPRQQKNHLYPERTNMQCVQSLQAHTNEERKYKDVYEVQNHASRTTYFKDESLSVGRFHDQLSEKKMSLVQNKFMEARCLAKNQNLHQSKDFWDAIKVLNSDTDTFLEFLQETNLLSDYLPNMTNCITVLKPTITLDASNENQLKKESTLAEVKVCSRNRNMETIDSIPPSLSHPTKIVVLKPSPSKSNLKELISSPTLQKRSPNSEYPFEELGNYETNETRKMAKKITQQMRDSFGSSNRRDESLPFSSLSNRYIGDDSSFRSEYMYIEEEFGKSSYPQAVNPTSHHLWDYTRRVTSPHSSSSCSRASISPESSVIREAKKRLSDRLAMVATDGTIQEQKKVQRSSSTLGEMLAISEARNERENYDEFVPNNRSSVEIQDMKGESSLSGSKSQSINLKEMPHRSLQKSLSLPSSPVVYGNIEKHLDVQKETTKTKGLKYSIRGKVSGFFSWNKKSTQEKYLESTSSDPFDNNLYDGTASKCKVLDRASDYLTKGPNHIFEESQSKNQCASTSNDCLKEEPQISKKSLFLEKPDFAGIPNQNMEQPSPVSVLEVPLEEDTSSCSSQSHDCASLECHTGAISKPSPLIESVARSLCWDDDACANNDLEAHMPAFNSKEEERMDYIKSLLSSAGFNNQTTISSLTNWYSHLSPLNPSLLEKFLDHKDEDARCRERRSRQRLLFDCVNHALIEIIHIDVSNACRHQSTNANFIVINEDLSNILVTDKVIEQVNSWFSIDDGSSTCPEIGNTGVLIHFFLEKEVCGREWEEMIYLEVMDIEKDIEKCMMEELVTEVMDGFVIFR